MDFLNELQTYVDEISLNEESVFKPVYIEDDEYENPASFVVEDDETGDTIATVSLYDEDGNVVDGVNGDYIPSEVTVDVETDGTEETKNLVAKKLKAMGFVNVVCDGEEIDMSSVADMYVDDDDEDFDDVKATVYSFLDHWLT